MKNKIMRAAGLAALGIIIALGGLYMGDVLDDPEVRRLEARNVDLTGDLVRAYLDLAAKQIEVMRYKVVLVSWGVLASHYTEASSGKTMANGRPFDEDLLTAAHRILEFGTIVLLENPENGRLCPAMITDWGPAEWTGCSLDVSLAVARILGIVEKGRAKVRCYAIVRGRPAEGD